MDSRALFPNRSGSPSATLSAAPRSSRPSSPRRTPSCKARCLPAFPPPLPSRAALDTLRDDSSFANPDLGRDSSFSALPELRPDRPLLRARPRSRSPPVLSPCTPSFLLGLRAAPTLSLPRSYKRECQSPTGVPFAIAALPPFLCFVLKRCHLSKLPTPVPPRPTLSVRPTPVPPHPTLSVRPTLFPPRPTLSVRPTLFPPRPTLSVRPTPFSVSSDPVCFADPFPPRPRTRLYPFP
uniref:Uncharacterized protein n=1 Tax=Setaria viridis TaxID=4556 RepID=A0A4U6TR64_SETVI|nr:hypothetical protein SEVIR_8G083400v2 [Setaria viridis]